MNVVDENSPEAILGNIHHNHSLLEAMLDAYTSKKIPESVRSQESRISNPEAKGGQYFLSTLGDTNWVGIDLEKILKGILSNHQITELAKISAGDVTNEYSFSHVIIIDSIPVRIRIRLRQSGNYDSETLRVGNRVFLESEEKYGDTYLSFSVEPGGNQEIVDDNTGKTLTFIKSTIEAAIQENYQNKK